MFNQIIMLFAQIDNQSNTQYKQKTINKRNTMAHDVHLNISSLYYYYYYFLFLLFIYKDLCIVCCAACQRRKK